MASKPNKANKGNTAASAATQSTALALPSTLPAGITIVKRVTLPSLAIKEPGTERILAIADAMRVSKIKDNSEQKRDPATICTAGDVLTGEAFTFIVPAVVKANLERDYPDDTYVGKVFRIKNMGKRNPSQRYNDFIIDEVDASGLRQAA